MNNRKNTYLRAKSKLYQQYTAGFLVMTVGYLLWIKFNEKINPLEESELRNQKRLRVILG